MFRVRCHTITGAKSHDDDDDDVLTIALISLNRNPARGHNDRLNKKVSMEEDIQVPKLYMHHSRTRTQAIGTSELWYTIPYHIQPSNARSITPTVFYEHQKEKKNGRGKTKERKIK